MISAPKSSIPPFKPVKTCTAPVAENLLCFLRPVLRYIVSPDYFQGISFYLRLIEAYKGSAVLLSCLKAPYAFCLSGQRFCKILKRSERLCETYVDGVTFCHDIHKTTF